MKIKDLPAKSNLGGVKFKHPETGEVCIWKSQWGYPDGEAGVFYAKPNDENKDRIYPLLLKDLRETLEFEVMPNRGGGK